MILTLVSEYGGRAAIGAHTRMFRALADATDADIKVANTRQGQKAVSFRCHRP